MSHKPDDPRNDPRHPGETVFPPIETPKPQWISSLNLPFILVLALSAWSLAGYINSNWVIQQLGERITSQSNRIETLHQQVNQNITWLRQIQDDQKKANQETADLLSKINLQLAEIKGATQKAVHR